MSIATVTGRKLRTASRLLAEGRLTQMGAGASRTVTSAFGGSRKPLKVYLPLPRKDWWQSLFEREVYELGTCRGPDFDGIYSPQYDGVQVDKYLHDQFREGAENHATRYNGFKQYETLLARELGLIGITPETAGEITALDVGSGAGNTVVPLLRLFPEMRLIASELSPEMLVQLKRALVELGLSGRCALLQLNAEELAFKPSSFDLIVGGGILHHLFSPHVTIKQCWEILKPGGTAIFFEPMRTGNMMLQLLFETILEKHYDELSAECRGYLYELVVNLDNQRVPDKHNSIFKVLDDKWMFSQWQLKKWADDAGFSQCTINPMHDRPNMLVRQTKQIIENYGGMPVKTLPNEARKLIEDTERSLPAAFKNALLVEACVILRK